MKDRNFDQDRRNTLKAAGLAGMGLLSSGLLASGIAKAALGVKTPAQPEGPFYPVKDQLDKDADMTQVRGRGEAALGESVILAGIVRDADTSAPVEGALVEFWQACASGKYDHPSDPNTAPLDPNFQYWAQVKTDGQGRFSLKTVRPGAYPAGDGWVRPPHIHVKIHRQGYPSLTTQIYFAGEALNDQDLILQRLSPAQRELVIVEFKPGDTADFAGAWTAWIGRSVKGEARHLVTPELD
ncbi:MAG: hypothetical protein RIQ81_1287 [Pseudomonadota bacterium]|jgi:protocatechuate 3,4-dioxygenase beta subunit